MKTPSDGYRRWPTSQWEGLLSLALPVLSDLDATWTLGGGTGLNVSLLKSNFLSIPLSQFIHVIDTTADLPEIWESVAGALKSGIPCSNEIG